MSNPTKMFFIKICCPHCMEITRGNENLIFYPKQIICMTCGKTLTGYRRVSKADYKMKIWIEYR